MENENQIDFYFHPEIIPDEIWDQILQYTLVKDLLNMSLVCKSFYYLIGAMNLTAMNRIVLQIGDYRKDIEDGQLVILRSSRIYTNIRVYYVRERGHISHVLDILEKYTTNLRIFEMKLCNITEQEFVDILEMIHANVKVLTLSLIDFRHSQEKAETDGKHFEFKKLETLSFDFSDREHDISDLLLNFMPDTICNIKFTCNNEFIDAAKYSRILQKQKHLKHLNLDFVVPNNMCYESLDIIDNSGIQFKLESLEVYLSFYYPLQMTEKFHRFLKSQTEFLKKFKLDCRTLTRYYYTFESMPKLEKLEVHCYKIRETQESQRFNCPMLKTLIFTFNEKISASSCFDFIKRFPKIEEIEAKKRISSELLQMIAENYPSIKKITLHKFHNEDFENVHLNNVVELIIEGVADNGDESSHDEDAKPQGIDMDNVFTALENLETLKFGETVEISSKNLQWILANFKKLKHLEIDNGSKLIIVFLCKMANQFGNLRYLKICNINESVEEFKDCLRQIPDLNYILSDRVAAKFEDFDFEDGCYTDDEDIELLEYSSGDDYLFS